MTENHRQDERMNDYLDGVLSHEEAAAFEAEMADDEELRAQVDATRALLRQAAALPEERMPEHDLWQGIARRMDGGAARKRAAVRWMTVAAAAAAVLFAVSLVRWQVPAEPASPPSAAHAASPGEAGYREAKAALLAALDNRQRELPQETREALDENLAVIENAAAELQAALAEHPNDPRLQHMLKTVYSTELDMLYKAVRLTS